MIAPTDLPRDVENLLGPFRRIRPANAIGESRTLEQQEEQVQRDDAGLEQRIGGEREERRCGAGDVLRELGLRGLAGGVRLLGPRRGLANDVFQLVGDLDGAGLETRSVVVEAQAR